MPHGRQGTTVGAPVVGAPAVVGSASPGHPGECGAVTAETAMVLPIVVALTLGLVWMVSLAATQVRVVDAAREVARSVARDEPTGQALDLGRRVAPEGARFSVAHRAGTVVVDVHTEVHGPGGLFGFLPPVRLHAEAVTAEEERS